MKQTEFRQNFKVCYSDTRPLLDGAFKLSARSLRHCLGLSLLCPPVLVVVPNGDPCLLNVAIVRSHVLRIEM